ncbi:SMC family ATPase [soil metagenome]
MRLHQLCMTAIGPFSGQVDIDFTKLGDSSLFLLEGPTGAGKSTVIDAISFALYGKVAQASASTDRLRSHHAPASAEPAVELVFETQSGIFRIRRTPSFERPKRDGSGTRKMNATVKLWRLGSPDDASGGESLSTRVAEADDEVSRAIGLTHDQFVQTVILPQGEFATFLRSRTEDKKALLQRLFGTEVLAGTQQRLVEGRKQAELVRAAAVAAVGQAVQAFVGAADLAPDRAELLDAAARSGDRAAVTGLVAEVTADLSTRRDQAARQLALAGAGRERAAAALSLARDRARRLQRRSAVRAEAAELAAAEPVLLRQRQELDAAERALTAVSAADALTDARAAAESATRTHEEARSQLPVDFAEAEHGTLLAASTALQTLRGQLGEELRREQRLADLVVAEPVLAEQLAELADVITAAAVERDALPGELHEIGQRRLSAAEVAGTAELLRGECDRAVARWQASVRAGQAAVLLAQDAEITAAAGMAWDQQEQRLASLRVTWRASVAGELGFSLRSGDPCDVCGSVEHPRPATRGKDHVSQADLDSAERESLRLRRLAEAARDQLEQQRADLRELQVIADQLNPDQAQAKVTELQEALDAAQAAADDVVALDSLLESVQTRLAALTSHIHDAEVQRCLLAERLSTLRAEIAEHTGQVLAARAGHRSVAARVDDITEQIRRLDRAAAAQQALSTALLGEAGCARRFVETLSNAGFANEAAWRSARRDRPSVVALRSAIRAHDDARAAVDRALADPELAADDLDDPLPGLDELVETLRVAQQRQDEDAATFGATSTALSNAQDRIRSLDAALAAGAQTLADTAAAIRLGNLAGGVGDNQLRMELTTYVLIRRFAEVAAAANAQLRRISGGRYELEHTDARSGNAKSGLGLRVLDLHTGQPRDPSTLSGGETFYVSLSLALGLADVVRSESGGVDLGTLFIDEGFGSLDADVLDEVLAVLDSLRAGGRVVGVVSHVAEMKSRIADRIEISRNADGSSRLKVVA